MIKEIKNLDIIMPTSFFGGVLDYTQYFRGTVYLEAHENYQKRSTRNKCFIKTSQGKKAISIPLRSGKNQQQSIQEVVISYEENWIKEFKHSIQTNYSAAPYIQFYMPELIKVIEEKPEHLWTLNWELNCLIMHFLGIESTPKATKVWQSNYDDNCLDLRSKHAAGSIHYEYPQLFKEKGQNFIENLSILDLLFCCGPEARIHLMNMAENLKA